MQKVKDIVVVSDYIYSDAILYDELTEAYRKACFHRQDACRGMRRRA